MALAEIEGRPTVAPGRRSLRADLHRMGISTPIKSTRVATHIAADQAECRPTLRLHLLGLVFNALLWCALGPVVKLIAPRIDILFRWGCALVAALMLGIGGLVWSLVFTSTVWATLALVPIVAWMLTIGLITIWAAVFDEDPTLSDAVTYWERHDPRSIWPTLPTNVQQLVRDLETELPDAKLRVLARDADPFLEVSRAGERLFVAAWPTGDETLDYVPLRT